MDAWAVEMFGDWSEPTGFWVTTAIFPDEEKARACAELAFQLVHNKYKTQNLDWRNEGGGIIEYYELATSALERCTGLGPWSREIIEALDTTCNVMGLSCRVRAHTEMVIGTT